MVRIADWVIEAIRRPWWWLKVVAPNLVAKVPGSAFEFDDGTPNGFTVTPVEDALGKPYGAFSVGHFEAAQYPSQFPSGNPLKDKVGSLMVNGGQWGPFATKFNFPTSSAYWQFDAVSPLLTGATPWQQVHAVEAWLADGYSTTGEHLTAALLLYIEQNGIRSMLQQVGGTVFHKVTHNAWTKLAADFQVPPGTIVRNVIVRVRGEWAVSSLTKGKYPLYDGGIGIDHVAAA